MATINQSETLEIVATETELVEGTWKMLQVSGDVKLWFGDDTAGVIATKGLILLDGSTLEPFDESDGDVLIYSLAGATAHIVR